MYINTSPPCMYTYMYVCIFNRTFQWYGQLWEESQEDRFLVLSIRGDGFWSFHPQTYDHHWISSQSHEFRIGDYQLDDAYHTIPYHTIPYHTVRCESRSWVLSLRYILSPPRPSPHVKSPPCIIKCLITLWNMEPSDAVRRCIHTYTYHTYEYEATIMRSESTYTPQPIRTHCYIHACILTQAQTYTYTLPLQWRGFPLNPLPFSPVRKFPQSLRLSWRIILIDTNTVR